MLHPGGGTTSTEQQWWSGKTLDIWSKTSSKNAARMHVQWAGLGRRVWTLSSVSRRSLLLWHFLDDCGAGHRWTWGHTGKFPKLHSTLPHPFQDSEDSLSQAGHRHREKRSGTFLTFRKRSFYFLDKFIRRDRCISYQKALPRSVACNWKRHLSSAPSPLIT